VIGFQPNIRISSNPKFPSNINIWDLGFRAGIRSPVRIRAGIRVLVGIRVNIRVPARIRVSIRILVGNQLDTRIPVGI